MRLAVLPLALLVAAMPAAAQINGTRQASAGERERGAPIQRHGWSGELDRIHDRTEAAREEGELTRREARSIHRREQLIRALGARYAAGGLTDAELAMLESQTFALRDQSQAPNRPVPASRRRDRGN